MVAFTAGLSSFLSPCVLALFPSYLSFVTGMSVFDLKRQPHRCADERRGHSVIRADVEGGVRVIGAEALDGWIVGDRLEAAAKAQVAARRQRR